MKKSHQLNGKSVHWKIGTSSVVTDSRFLEGHMHQVAEGTRQLIDAGYAVTGITSGAVQVGRNMIPGSTDRAHLSTLGQIELYEQWRRVFRTCGLKVGQILLQGGRMPRPLVHQVQAHAEMGTVPLCNENDAYDIWQILGLNNGSDNDANMPVVDRLQRRAGFDVIAGISFTQLPGVLDDDDITVQIRETISRKVIRAYKSYAFEGSSPGGTGGINSKIDNLAKVVRKNTRFGVIAEPFRGFDVSPGDSATFLFRDQCDVQLEDTLLSVLLKT